MANSGRHRLPATSAPPRTRSAVEAESKLARKSDVVEALRKIHSDRPVQAYNELAQKAEEELQDLWKKNKGSTDDLARTVQHLCAVHHVSWTKVHYDRTRGKDSADNRRGNDSADGAQRPTSTLLPCATLRRALSHCTLRRAALTGLSAPELANETRALLELAGEQLCDQGALRLSHLLCHILSFF